MHPPHSFVGTVLALLLSACASGSGYAKIEDQLPTLTGNQSRIYIYTPVRDFALNFQPQILVNREAVGVSRPGTFLVVDRPSGDYSLEADQQATFAAFGGELNSVAASIYLAPGTTAYVRMQVDDDGLALRAESISEDSENGQHDLRNLTYQGGNALPQGN